jgi:hypothetical protein
MSNITKPKPTPKLGDQHPTTRLLRFDQGTGTYCEARKTERFIRGPIPLWWITAANQLPGKAGCVGLGLWFLKGVQAKNRIKLTSEVKQIAGCGRTAVYNALAALKGAGLVNVYPRPGSYPEVEILLEHGCLVDSTPAKNK